MSQHPPVDGDLPRDDRADGAAVDEPAPAHRPEAVQSLKQAMRRARFDDAERLGVLADARGIQIGRLELLQEALQPLLAQIPKDVDLFDVGLMPGATPRLFIDMIGFVEMGRDQRLYRLLQDTRHVRLTLAESTDIGRMVEAITDYVARRLLERDKALAADARDRAARDDAGHDTAATAAPAEDAPAERPVFAETARPPEAPLHGWRKVQRGATIAFAFVIDLLGAMTLFTILAFGVWLVWNRLHGQI